MHVMCLLHTSSLVVRIHKSFFEGLGGGGGRGEGGIGN